MNIIFCCYFLYSSVTCIWALDVGSEKFFCFFIRYEVIIKIKIRNTIWIKVRRSVFLFRIIEFRRVSIVRVWNLSKFWYWILHQLFCCTIYINQVRLRELLFHSIRSWIILNHTRPEHKVCKVERSATSFHHREKSIDLLN